MWRKVDAIFQIARRDEVDSDLAGNELSGERAGEEGNADFSNMVTRSQFSRGDSVGSGIPKVDDPAPALRKEGEGGLGGEKSSGCGAVKSAEPIFGTGSEERGGAIGTGIVYEEIEATELATDFLKHSGDLSGLG